MSALTRVARRPGPTACRGAAERSTAGSGDGGAGGVDGADGAGSIALTAPTLPVAGGFAVTSNTGTVLIINQNGTDVLRVELTNATTGAYTVTQLHAIDHPTGLDENNVQFTVNYLVTDHDGDTATGTFVVDVDDDTPTGGVTTAIQLDDDTMPGGNAASTTGDLAVPNTDADNNEATFGGTLTLNFGGDGAGSVDFASMNGTTGSVGTETVSYGWNGTTHILTATGPRGVLFTVEVTNPATGAYKVTLVDNVLHASLDGLAGDDTENVAYSETASTAPLPLHVILLAEVIADLHQHGDAFGEARLIRRGLVGIGAEFPAIAVADDRDDEVIRTIGMDLQFGPRHGDEFGFGLGRLAHIDALPA